MGWFWLIGLALIGAAPVLAWLRRKPVNAAARQNAPGEFANLACGLTHYQWHGRTGPVAVCVHGLTTPSYVWDAVATDLVAQGFAVLTYDLFGRGLSARVTGAQDAGFFNRQLEELLADQDVSEPITLLGYSMGGAIVTCFGAKHPDRVKRLILLAPAGIKIKRTWLHMLIVKLPVIGDWLMLITGGASLRRGVEAESKMPSAVPDIYARQMRETYMRGFLPAVLSSYRNLLSGELAREHKLLAKSGIPLATIWGGADAVIPVSGRDRLAELNPEAYQVIIPDAPHALTYTHTDQVMGALKPFLQG